MLWDFCNTSAKTVLFHQHARKSKIAALAESASDTSHYARLLVTFWKRRRPGSVDSAPANNNLLTIIR
jgi:hypothetical protein